MSVTYSEKLPLPGTGVLDNAFLTAYDTAALRPPPDLERVPTCCVG